MMECDVMQNENKREEMYLSHATTTKRPPTNQGNEEIIKVEQL